MSEQGETIAAVKVEIAGGEGVDKMFSGMTEGTKAVLKAMEELNKRLDAVGTSATTSGDKVVTAVQEGTGAIKEQMIAQEAARVAAAAKAAEEAKAAAEAAKAARDAKRALKDQEKAAKEVADAVKGIGNAAIDATKEIIKMSGAKTGDQMRKGADELEEMLERARISMGKTKKEWEDMNAVSTIKDVAKFSGKAPSEVVKGLMDIQNETSGGEALLANQGALFKKVAGFSQVADSKVGETGITVAKFGEQFRMTPEEMAQIPAALIKQQMQGSLEAGTASKFVKNAASYRNLTGKTGLAGFLEFLALGNVVKDERGLTGESGAASASTNTGALIDSLSKGKSVTGFDTSATTMLKKLAGIDIRDKDGHIMLDKLGPELLKYKSKVGDRKFNEMMGMTFRETKARGAAIALMSRAESNPTGEKSLGGLANPNIGEGQQMIDQGLTDLGQIHKAKEQDMDTEALFKTLKTKSSIQGPMDWVRDNVQQFAADHPVLTSIGGVLGAAGAKKYGLNALGAVGSKVAGVGAGLFPTALAIRALTMAGDNANASLVDGSMSPQDQLKTLYGEKARLLNEQALAKPAAERRPLGLFEPRASKEDIGEQLKSIVEQIKRLEAPTVTVNVTAPGVEARVVQEAHPTNSIARGPGAPATAPTPGRR